jgi:hypothetical protein
VTVEKFLFVQANFDLIAYRQGLSPQIVGQLSRFAWWSQLGSALELKLTRKSIVLGLDWGLTAESMLEILTRHSQRPLPPAVIDAVKTWTSRRERVTFYPAVTLIEFGSAAERDLALEFWPTGDDSAPLPLADRFLLVEDEQCVPFDRLRLISSRDYRQAGEACVLVDPDGVSLTLDSARADLLIEAELARFADPVPNSVPHRAQATVSALRRYAITPASLQRAMGRGFGAPQLSEWFTRRTGRPVPPALQLLVSAQTFRPQNFKFTRTVALRLPTAEVLEGLLQHPATSPLLGDRLGPKCVAIADDQIEPLERALKELGINLAIESES